MTDVATEHDPWMLPKAKYEVRISLFRIAGEEIVETLKVSKAEIQVDSKAEARYYFNQFTDLARRVKKLNRAVDRLFRRSTANG